MPKRVQSPSSINLFKQCPRKYYFRYIKRLPTKPNIHLVRGSAVHSALEDFFDMDISETNFENYKSKCKTSAQKLLAKHWTESTEDLKKLNMSKEEIEQYFAESILMLFNWLELFYEKVEQNKKETFKQTFEELKPMREIEYISNIHSVRGYIDAIENRNGAVHLMDYKTSKKDIITQDYELQLAIYALLYLERHGKLPEKVGIYFLKAGEQLVDVTQEMVDFAKTEIALIHERTETSDIRDYPQNITPLCKWKTGECDYYDLCFKQKNINDFVKVNIG